MKGRYLDNHYHQILGLELTAESLADGTEIERICTAAKAGHSAKAGAQHYLANYEAEMRQFLAERVSPEEIEHHMALHMEVERMLVEGIITGQLEKRIRERINNSSVYDLATEVKDWVDFQKKRKELIQFLPDRAWDPASYTEGLRMMDEALSNAEVRANPEEDWEKTPFCAWDGQGMCRITFRGKGMLAFLHAASRMMEKKGLGQKPRLAGVPQHRTLTKLHDATRLPRWMPSRTKDFWRVIGGLVAQGQPIMSERTDWNEPAQPDEPKAKEARKKIRELVRGRWPGSGGARTRILGR